MEENVLLIKMMMTINGNMWMSLLLATFYAKKIQIIDTSNLMR